MTEIGLLWAAVYGAFVLGLISPGPDFALVSALAMRRGRGAGIAAAAGIAVGVGLWVAAAAAGLATVLQAAPDLWQGVQLVAGGVLIYMGARALSAAIRGASAEEAAPDGGPHPMLLGLLTNLANPKAALVLAGLVSVLAEGRRSAGEIFLMGLGMPLLTLGWFALVATVLARPELRGRLLARRRLLDGAVGIALAGVGAAILQQVS